MFLALLLLVGATPAAESVLVTPPEAAEGVSGAVALRAGIQDAVERQPDLRLVLPSATAVDGVPGEAWLAACPDHARRDCALRLAGALDVRFVVTGRVDGEGLEISIFDRADMAEAGSLEALPGAGPELAARVAAGLGRLARGEPLEAPGAVEAEAPVVPQDPERAVTGADAAGLDEGAGRFADPDAAARLASRRRGRVTVTLAGGYGHGPRDETYGARYVLDPTGAVLDAHARQALAPGWGTSLGVTLGLGLTSFLEAEVGLSREGGTWRVDVVRETDGGEAPDPGSGHRGAGVAQGRAGLRAVVLPARVVRPGLALGGFAGRGSAVDRGGPLPVEELPVYSPRVTYGVYGAPAVEVRLGHRMDLLVQAPVQALLAGTAAGSFELEGGGLEPLPEPEAAPTVDVALQVGMRFLLGGD